MPEIRHQFPVVDREIQRLKEILKAKSLPLQYDSPESYFSTEVLYDFAWTPDACIRQLRALLHDEEWRSLAEQVKELLNIDFDYMVRKAIRDQIQAVEQLIKMRCQQQGPSEVLGSFQPIVQH